jgi:formate/nitrite transporter
MNVEGMDIGTMSYVKPDQVIRTMIQTGAEKAHLGRIQWLLRGFLGGALLGFATTLAFTATVQTSFGIAGALVFPAGFAMIVLLGLELVTGNFAVIPAAVMAGKTTAAHMLGNWLWVFVGHLLGAVVYAVLYVIAATKLGHVQNDAVAALIAKMAEAKTTGYSSIGAAGLIVCTVKAMLCNWMVCLGAVMAMTSQSTAGKILAMWLPVLTFFAQGFEHAVVNMFVIPAGMMLGAKVSFADWWLWNQIPVTVGNLIGGFLFTGLLLYLTQIKAGKQGAPSMTKEASLPISAKS